MTDAELIRAAEWLAGEIRLAERQDAHTIPLTLPIARRLCDALLAAVNRVPLR